MNDNIVVDLDVLCETYEIYRIQRNRFAEDIEKLNGIIKMLEQGMVTIGGEEAIKAAQAIYKKAQEQLVQMDAATAFVHAKYQGYIEKISGTGTIV